MGLARTTGLASAVAVAGVWLFAACSSFDGDSGPLPDAGGLETGATSSSSSSSGTSGTSGTSSSSGNPLPGVDAGGACAVTTCGGGSVLCDNFERDDPAGPGTDWTFSGTQSQDANFVIDESPDSTLTCGKSLKAYVGKPTGSGISSRLIEQLLNGEMKQLTIDFDLTIDVKLGEYGEEEEDRSYTALVALSPTATLTADSPFSAIMAVKDGLVLGGQLANAESFTTGGSFSLTMKKRTHITWTLSTMTGASSIAIEGTRVLDTTLPTLANGQAPTQLHLFLGVASKNDSPSVATRYDNLSVVVQ